MKNFDKNSFIIDDVFKMIDKKLKKKEKKIKVSQTIESKDDSEMYVINI